MIHDEAGALHVMSSVPIGEWLWEAAFAEGGEVQGVRLLVRPTRLDVQVLEYVHFALETNLKQTKRTQVISKGGLVHVSTRWCSCTRMIDCEGQAVNSTTYRIPTKTVVHLYIYIDIYTYFCMTSTLYAQT